MEIILGTLSFRNRDSILTIPEGQAFWLLRVGFGDTRQAGVAATHFIKDVQHLRSGRVAVVGTRGVEGSQRVIKMSEINAVGAWGRAIRNVDLQPDLLVMSAQGTAKRSSAKKTGAKRTKRTSTKKVGNK